MKAFILLLLIVATSSAGAQLPASLNFCDSLDGIWSVSLSNKKWQEENLQCYEVKTIQKDGTIGTVRTCNKKELNREEIEKWTRFDRESMQIFGRYYLSATNSWSTEMPLYRVISISSTAIILEIDLETFNDESDILRFTLKRVT